MLCCIKISIKVFDKTLLLHLTASFSCMIPKNSTPILNYELSVYPQNAEVGVCGFVTHLDTTDFKAAAVQEPLSFSMWKFKSSCEFLLRVCW